jgi:hypothetical protein
LYYINYEMREQTNITTKGNDMNLKEIIIDVVTCIAFVLLMHVIAYTITN